MLQDAVQIGVLQLQDLVEPVDELDIGIAAQLAEHGGALDRPVGEAVEFPEKGDAADIGHLLRSCHGVRAATRPPDVVRSLTRH